MSERPNRSGEPSLPRGRRAVTLVELLLVIAMLGILASFVLASYEPALGDQLRGAAQVVVADVAYARSLAVSNNSLYRLTFDIPRNRYWLEHSGTNSALHTLPDSPYRDAVDGADRQTTDLSQLPALSGDVELVAVHRVSETARQSTTALEFGSLGSLTSPESAVIWLGGGGPASRRYVPVEVDPVTGLSRIGELQVEAPPIAN